MLIFSTVSRTTVFTVMFLFLFTNVYSLHADMLNVLLVRVDDEYLTLADAKSYMLVHKLLSTGDDNPDPPVTDLNPVLLDNIVKEWLLASAFRNSPTETEIDQYEKKVLDGFSNEAAFLTQLDLLNLDRQLLRSEISRYIKKEKYVKRMIIPFIFVSKKEVDSYLIDYDIRNSTDNINQLRLTVKNNIMKQKLHDRRENLIDKLRGRASIEFIEQGGLYDKQ